MICPIHTITVRRDALNDAVALLAASGSLSLSGSIAVLEGEVRGLSFTLDLLRRKASAESNSIVEASRNEIGFDKLGQPALSIASSSEVIDDLSPVSGVVEVVEKGPSSEVSNPDDTATSPGGEEALDATVPARLQVPCTQKERVLAAYQRGLLTGGEIANATGIKRGSVDAVMSILRKGGKLPLNNGGISGSRTTEVSAKPDAPF